MREGWFDRQARGIADDKRAWPDWMKEQSEARMYASDLQREEVSPDSGQRPVAAERDSERSQNSRSV
jgi:hypothetical protein